MTYKESFIKFMVECGILTFGEFTLKSGRKAPYFINCGNYKTGAQLAKLGEYYAECIHANNIPFCEANAIKYLCRWRSKNGIEDLKKARHYIDLLIELETKQ